MNLHESLQQIFEKTVEFRRNLHQYPELSGAEYETTEKIVRRLEEMGIEYVRPAGTGVIAVIRGSNPGKVIGLRADMDALPIQEDTGLSFQSLRDGVMHACGHDTHTASLLAAAEILHANRDMLSGTVKCIFQPSEEALPSGALQMVESGYLKDCSAIIGTHAATNLPVGTISAQAGPRMAASAGIDIRVRGKGGHAGSPSLTVDATVTAAAILMNLQTIASRELSLDNPAVVSVTTFHSGSARNVISDEAVLSGTCRYFSQEAIRQVSEAVERIAKNTAAAYRADAEVSVIPSGCEAVINDAALADTAASVVTELFGGDALRSMPVSCGNEDFSYYSRICPILFAMIGAQNPENPATSISLHNPRVQLDERCMYYAAGFYVKMAWELLNAK